MSRKKRTPFAIDRDGEDLYVELGWSAIHPMVIACDGLSLIYFGDDLSRPYLRVADVIDWHDRELRDSHGHSGSAVARDALREALQKFKEGRVRDTNAV